MYALREDFNLRWQNLGPGFDPGYIFHLTSCSHLGCPRQCCTDTRSDNSSIFAVEIFPPCWCESKSFSCPVPLPVWEGWRWWVVAQWWSQSWCEVQETVLGPWEVEITEVWTLRSEGMASVWKWEEIGHSMESFEISDVFLEELA